MLTRQPPSPKRRSATAPEVTSHPESRSLIREKPLEIERDTRGWPIVFWTLAGSAPEFDVGDRTR